MNLRLLLSSLMLAGLCVGLRSAFDRNLNPERSPGTASTEGDGLDIPAPEFTGVTEWVNFRLLKLTDQKGKVVVVHFWTNGCVNCIHNYPHYRAWTKKYEDNRNLLIVGIHTPEFEEEKDLDRIKQQAAENQLTFPIAVDNDRATWKAWGNRYWPCIYLVDKSGKVRHRWEGELGSAGYKKVTGQIEALLAEKSPVGG